LSARSVRIFLLIVVYQVTSDPASQNPKTESAGTVTSDSLAAESLSSGGSFASGNATASAQPSKGFTGNTTDTSGATTLNAGPDAEARQSQEAWSEQGALNAGSGLGKDAGQGSTYTTPSDDAKSGADASSGEYNTSTGSGTNTGAAPSYVNAGAGIVEDSQKPKGQNITEGGFSSDAPNASFNNDVGGKNDPGRLAEQKMQLHTAQSGGDAGGPRQKGVTGDGQYDALSNNESA